ncbi:MAG: mechanosensitive ion channel [Verrucomicrobiales bacterium]|nr:mechanosensitive ion channel [Verrucomicrobiales bacterium]
MDTLLTFLPTAAVAALGLIALVVVHRYILHAHLDTHGQRFRNQSVMLALTAIIVIVVVLSLPLTESLRGQVLTLLGILLSASIALASTTLVANGMAGLMIRGIRSFRIGDFITTGDHFGRVTEIGLFHTEIQTEDRDLTTLPNLYLVANPVKTILRSGTIVSATVSLGYDVPRGRIEAALLEAAEACRLKEAFVQIRELGDFSVTYRIAGFLAEVKTLLTVRSALRAAIMDALHARRIEIVSPRFQNTRTLTNDQVFIPPASDPPASETPSPTAETIVFDKAEAAASIESLRATCDKLAGRMGELQQAAKEAEGAEREKLEAELTRLTARREHLATVIADREAKAAEEKGN